MIYHRVRHVIDFVKLQAHCSSRLGTVLDKNTEVVCSCVWLRLKKQQTGCVVSFVLWGTSKHGDLGFWKHATRSKTLVATEVFVFCLLECWKTFWSQVIIWAPTKAQTALKSNNYSCQVEFPIAHCDCRCKIVGLTTFVSQEKKDIKCPLESFIGLVPSKTLRLKFRSRPPFSDVFLSKPYDLFFGAKLPKTSDLYTLKHQLECLCPAKKSSFEKCWKALKRRECIFGPKTRPFERIQC